MVIKSDRKKIVFLLTLIYFVASFFTYTYAICGMLMLFTAILVFFMSATFNKGRIKIKLDMFHLLTFTFMLFCFMSCLWAENSSYSYLRASMIFEILLTVVFLYVYYGQYSTSDDLLKVVMWGGYIVIILAFMTIGIDSIFSILKAGDRMTNDFLNANTIGMLAAYAVIVNFYYILRDKKIMWWSILGVPAIIVIAVSGSRKSLLLVVMGIGLLLLMHYYDNRRVMNSFLRIILATVVFVIILFFLSRLSIFTGILERMQGLVNLLLGTGTIDASSNLRSELTRLGIELFKTSPIIGIGIDNAKIYSHKNYYLHNNFAELLSGGGIIGTVLFYSIYIYPLYKMFKYRKVKGSDYDIVIVLLICHVIMDYGLVSYYGKSTYFYFLLYFVQVKIMKQDFMKLKRERDNDSFNN